MVSISRRRLLFAAVVSCLAAPGAWPGTAPAAKKNPSIRFGVIAEKANEPDRMLRVYSDFLAEMRWRLAPQGIDVADLVIAQDVADLARRIERAEVDFVAETVFVTHDLQQGNRAPLLPRMAVVKRNQREYYSVFFARKDGRIKSLQDLRGRTLVLQAERSTSAFAVPRAELTRHGIKSVPAGRVGVPHGSAFYVLAGAELNQAIWVLNGKGDAGAFNELDWARLPQRVRDGLVIIHQTKPLLRGVVSFRAGFDPRVRAACEEVLLALQKEPAGQAALKTAGEITRFERLTPNDLTALSEWRLALQSAAGH
jgi:phosphonate transport system substrate-binding protein